jgi:hypothetical protein
MALKTSMIQYQSRVVLATSSLSPTVQLLRASKLQIEIALSTVKSEFTALSQSMRSLIPLLCVREEINTSFCLTSDPIPYTVKSTVFEDNTGALTLAKTKKMTAHTRHMAVKYFWFLNKTHPHGPVHIEKVDSSQGQHC